MMSVFLADTTASTNTRRYIWNLFSFAAATFLVGCGAPPPETGETWTTMGTFAAVSTVARDRAKLPQYVSESKEIFDELNALLTVYRDDSEISHINRNAGEAPLAVSETTWNVLSGAALFARVTDGCFDPTVAPLVGAWGFNGRAPLTAPLREDIVRNAVALVGVENLILSNRTVRLALPGMMIDLGGIAKGYAVDRAYDALLRSGAEDVMINLGGNIRCGGVGRPPDGAWRVAVRNPFKREASLGTLMLRDGQAVATSGHYENFFELQGERYTHIIDPRSGYPARGMAGVTVVCRSATEADALSTGLFVAGIDEAWSILEQVPDCHALFVPDRQPLEIWITPGFADFFVAAREHRNAVHTLIAPETGLSTGSREAP